MKIDSIIFDLDGTLFDSSDLLLDAFNSAIKDMEGVQRPITQKELESVLGLNMQDSAAVLFPYMDRESQLRTMSACCRNQAVWVRKYGGHIYENVQETLRKLSYRYSLYIVSNCPDGYIEAYLEYYKLKDYVSGFSCSGVTGLTKAENIVNIIKDYSLKNPIYVGDTQKDCDSAKIAKIPLIYAAYGFGVADSYDYKIEDISELVKVTDYINESNK